MADLINSIAVSLSRWGRVSDIYGKMHFVACWRNYVLLNEKSLVYKVIMTKAVYGLYMGPAGKGTLQQLVSEIAKRDCNLILPFRENGRARPAHPTAMS